MPSFSFESVLQRAAKLGSVDPRPSPIATTSAAGTLFLDSMRSEIARPKHETRRRGQPPEAYLTHVESAHSNTFAEREAIGALARLLDASGRMLRRIEVQGATDPALLRHLRLEYARRHHPDVLPPHLKGIANSLMAEINARLDAAIAGAWNS